MLITIDDRKVFVEAIKLEIIAEQVADGKTTHTWEAGAFASYESTYISVAKATANSPLGALKNLLGTLGCYQG